MRSAACAGVCSGAASLSCVADLRTALGPLALALIARISSGGVPGGLVELLVALAGVEVCAHPSMRSQQQNASVAKPLD
jgi:hypothetical protein